MDGESFRSFGGSDASSTSSVVFQLEARDPLFDTTGLHERGRGDDPLDLGTGGADPAPPQDLISGLGLGSGPPVAAVVGTADPWGSNGTSATTPSATVRVFGR